MRILDIRPQHGSGLLAVFDVEMNEHLRLYNLELRRAPNGRVRTFAPKAGPKHAASFHPFLAEQMTRAAEAALGGHTANAER